MRTSPGLNPVLRALRLVDVGSCSAVARRVGLSIRSHQVPSLGFALALSYSLAPEAIPAVALGLSYSTSAVPNSTVVVSLSS